MFESKKWYREVIILIVIPLIVYVSFRNTIFSYGHYGLLLGLAITLIFIGLAVWRKSKKMVTVTEIIVLILLNYFLQAGSALLLPRYQSTFLGIGLLFLIIWRIHERSVGKATDEDLTTRSFM